MARNNAKQKFGNDQVLQYKYMDMLLRMFKNDEMRFEMVKHIVFWRFQEEAQGSTKAQNMAKVKEMLMALPPIIGEIIDLEVGENFSGREIACDMALYSTFESEEALKAYAVHPEHVKVAEFIGSVISEGRVVDYHI